MADAPTPQPAQSGGGGARFWILALVIGLAIIVAGVLIYQASMAAFTAQTETAANSFSSGEIDITNDSTESAVFALTNLQPGDTGTDDIVVTYTGTLDSEVRLFASDSGAEQDLAPFLQLTITADGATGSPWEGTLAEFQAIQDFGGGILPVTMAPDATQTYSVAFEVLGDAPMGSSADVTFVWEAQSLSEN